MPTRPLHDRNGLAAIHHNYIFPGVAVLFYACCPTAIRWLVVAIAVWVAIKRVIFGRSRTHVL